MLKSLWAENKVTATKIAEQMKVQQVTMKDSKKFEAGKRLADGNHRKREEHAHLTKAKSDPELTLLRCLSHCSHWHIRHSWLLHLPIQENS